MIRKITLPYSNYGRYGNDIESIDYNPREDLILIKLIYSIYIISLVKLRIFTYEHPLPINELPFDLSKSLS